MPDPQSPAPSRLPGGPAGDPRPDLRDLSHEELEALVGELGESRFRADQLFRWIHSRGASSFEEMTDLGKDFRQRLGESSRLGTLEHLETVTSADGSAKLGFRTGDGRIVESVLMPEDRKVSVCLSTQVGCGMGCAFCATARLGLGRSLTAGEIVDQLYRIRAQMEATGDRRRISNIVYMGMGEPLANPKGTLRSLELLLHPLGASLSTRRITVSTAGVIPGLELLAAAPHQVNLAISLNATTQEVRARLMPIARQYPLDRLLGAVRAFPLEKRRRITWEYVLISGVNDSDEDARRLPRLIAGIPSKLNVIVFNPIDGCELRAPRPERVEAFCEPARRAGYTVMLRQSRGADVSAACGQLAGRLSVSQS
ncbi:MAG: 23S rRNA (adenine(2503)-C(2))-methyltransferase RlmN [Polyangia bacterium]|jgi:23S rRNA (adenine2503-C2)-methyltransferase|nr:23S rRNA (adenine(2503)-C(2))-methyltransferase RlmN [Polyangia bacterium]